MRLLLAIFMPWLQFFTIGRPLAGIICLALQCTVIGWIPAVIWSTHALGQFKTDKKIEKALSIKSSQSNRHTQCGHPVPLGANFCPSCGAKAQAMNTLLDEDDDDNIGILISFFMSSKNTILAIIGTVGLLMFIAYWAM